MALQILDNIGDEWEEPQNRKSTSGTGTNAGFTRKRFLQKLSDVVARPVNNRVQAPTTPAAVVCNGAVQSTGIGTGPIMPMLFGEHLVQARVTLNAPVAGNYYSYTYRSTT